MLSLTPTTTFTRTVKFRLPGEGTDTERDASFVATFKAMAQDDWEAMVENASRSEALRAVLVDVKGVAESETTGEDGAVVKVSPVEVVIRNAFACDAAFGEYVLYVGSNSRRSYQDAAQAKNSRRSRGR
jgi:hypothetical protein